MIQAFVVIVHRHRKHTLGALLPDHIIIKHVADFERGWNAAIFLADKCGFGFLTNDVIAQVNTFIADEHRWPSNKLTHFML